MRTWRLPVFALLLLALGCLPAFAAAPAPARAPSPDKAKAQAAAFLEKGKAGEAYDLYIGLLRKLPDDDAVNLGLARAATRSRHWNQAVMAYETLLEKYPREAVLYKELAEVYMLLGDREAAERNLEVMRSLDGATSKEDTTRALDSLEARYSDLQLHGKVRAGVLYDSNANLGPASNTLDLGDWRIRVTDAKSKETFAAYLGADLDLGRRFYRDSPWWVVGDASAFIRGNAEDSLHKSRSQESQWGRGAVGLRHLTFATLTELRLKAEIFDYELYQHVSAYGPEGTMVWAVNPTVQLVLKGGLDKREYSRDHQRDGLYGWAGLYGRFFFGEDKHEFLVGGRFLGADANHRAYGYDGWEAMARLMLKLPYGFELTPSLSFSEERYNGPATALEHRKRRDDRLRAGLGLTYRINEAWALEAGYQYTFNESTSALYEYKQNVVSTGLVFSF